MSKDKKKIKQQLKEIEKNSSKVFIIHYSCEHFEKDRMKSPRIFSISIKNYQSGLTTSFSINKIAEINKVKLEDIENRYDELEKSMLTEYFEFIGRHKDCYYVNWRMSDVKYGFAAINHRYKVLGGEPIEIDDTRLYNLSKMIIDFYGENYIESPRLENLAKKNNINIDNFFYGEKEAKLLENKDYTLLHSSNLKKVDVLFDILKLYINGKLKTDKNIIKIKIDEVLESSAYKVISIITTIWALISIFKIKI